MNRRGTSHTWEAGKTMAKLTGKDQPGGVVFILTAKTQPFAYSTLSIVRSAAGGKLVEITQLCMDMSFYAKISPPCLPSQKPF